MKTQGVTLLASWPPEGAAEAHLKQRYEARPAQLLLQRWGYRHHVRELHLWTLNRKRLQAGWELRRLQHGPIG